MLGNIGVLLLLPLIVSPQSTPQHASASLRLNKAFFELASEKTKEVIDRLSIAAKLQNVNITSGDNIRFWTRWINVTSVDFPSTTFSISKKGLNWQTKGGEILIQAYFLVRYSMSPVGPFFTKSAIADVTVKELKTDIDGLIKSVNSRPQLVVDKCAMAVEVVDVTIRNSDIIEIILNKCRQFISDAVRRLYAETACKLIINVTDKANAFVRAQPDEIRVWKNIYVNYTTTQDPEYFDDYVQAQCSFRVDVKDKEIEHEEELFTDPLRGLEINDFEPFDQADSNSIKILQNLRMIKDVIVYALALYGFYCCLGFIIVRRRDRRILLSTKGIENKALQEKNSH